MIQTKSRAYIYSNFQSCFSFTEEEKKEASLLQRLLSKATHPSPLKALFNVEELESAALSVCQFLASAAAAKRSSTPSPEVQEMLNQPETKAVTSKDLKLRKRSKAKQGQLFVYFF